MLRLLPLLLVLGAPALHANETTSSEKKKNHEVGCLAATLGGALLGGVIGKQFGGGDGKSLLTVAGAVAGGAAAGKSHACK